MKGAQRAAVLRDARARLARVQLGARRADDELVDVVREVLNADMGLFYSHHVFDESRLTIDRLACTDSRIEEMGRPLVNRLTNSRGFYSPYVGLRPEAKVQNKAMLLDEIVSHLDDGQRRELFRSMGWCEFGLEQHDQVRALVCDDDGVLLAWVGAFRREPFTETEKRDLQALVPSLAARLRFEDRLNSAGMLEEALNTSLDALTTPAGLLTETGVLVTGNALLRERLEAQPASVRRALTEAAHGRPSPWRSTEVEATGAAKHVLVQLDAPPLAVGVVSHFARWFGLSPREHEVLVMVVEGRSNKAVSAALKCSVRTVEAHVSRILERTGVESRAQLVAQLWARSR